MQSDAAIICEAMTSANAIVTHLAVAGCLVGAESRPRRTEYEKALYDGYRVSLWLRFFADESPKLDRAIDLPYANISAIDDFVIKTKVWPDPLRFKPSLSAMSAAIPSIMDARSSGGFLMRTVERIVGRNSQDLWSVESMRWQAEALEANLAEVFRDRDDLRFAIETHTQAAESWASRVNQLFPPLEFERRLIGAPLDPDGDWIEIDQVSDFIKDPKTVRKFGADGKTGVKVIGTKRDGAQRAGYRYYVHRSKLSDSIKPSRILKYKSRQ